MTQTPVTHQQITLDGIGNVHYATAGEGPAVLLLHGLGASLVTWNPTILALAQSYTVFAPDLPGHGGSAKPRLDYNLDFGVRFALAFLDALSLPSATLIGNSMGGLVALATALRFPSRVEALGLVSAAGLGRDIAWPLRLASIPGIGVMLAAIDARFGAGLLKRLFYQPERVDPEIRREILRLAADPEVRRTVIDTVHSSISLFGLRRSLVLLNEMVRLTRPVLVVWGQQDRIIPATHANRAAHQLPNSRVYVLDNCGHLPQLEEPGRFNQLALDFLASAVGSAEERPSH